MLSLERPKYFPERPCGPGALQGCLKHVAVSRAPRALEHVTREPSRAGCPGTQRAHQEWPGESQTGSRGAPRVSQICGQELRCGNLKFNSSGALFRASFSARAICHFAFELRHALRHRLRRRNRRHRLRHWLRHRSRQKCAIGCAARCALSCAIGVRQGMRPRPPKSKETAVGCDVGCAFCRRKQKRLRTVATSSASQSVSQSVALCPSKIRDWAALATR